MSKKNLSVLLLLFTPALACDTSDSREFVAEDSQEAEDARTPRGKSDAIGGSCVDDDGVRLCGGAGLGTCYCDVACDSYGDCCDDHAEVCAPVEALGEVCTNGEDDNFDGLHDCEDPLCADDPSCDVAAPTPSCDGVCERQAPAGCWCDSSCVDAGDCCPDYVEQCEDTRFSEVCFNGEDADGLYDCDDPLCADDAACHVPAPAASCEGTCGLQAADGCWCDSGCMEYGDCCDDYGAVCEDVEFSEVCFNGEDDNGNGLIDCQDPECDLDPDCT
jgi:Somatomedin B domain